MALATKEVRQTTVNDGDTVQSTREVTNPAAEKDHGKIVAARVIWFITGVITVLLAIRFVFVLLGANTDNGLVNFIYSITYPLVAPFFGIFSYDFTAGIARFEYYTLIAMAFYALLAWGITKAMTLNRRTNDV